MTTDFSPLLVALHGLTDDERAELAGLFLAGSNQASKNGTHTHAAVFAELAVVVASVTGPEVAMTAQVLRSQASPNTFFGTN